MKFTLSWLKQHLNTDATLTEITDKLTAIGLELEDIDEGPLAPFVVARVVEANQHPNADKLRVCTVDAGTGTTFNVVCGAPNARTGMKGVFAPVGTYVPGTDMMLELGNLRGERSEGMLCSERELMLSDDHDGIIDLPADAPVGVRYIDYQGLADPVIEINVTPNRGDALGVRGVARDLAAAGLGALKPQRAEFIGGAGASPKSVHIDTNNCPVFFYRVIRGVKNGESPKWVQEALKAVGERPISALVDITNLMTLDQARPMHVYDLAKVKGDLRVRLGQDGEKLAALNDKTYSFDEHMTLVTDDSGPIGVGGIIGGASTGVDETTTDVLLEGALWDATNIARTGRKLNVHTNARYRFERHTDSQNLAEHMGVATQLILDWCGGKAGELQQAGAVPGWTKVLNYAPSLCAKRGGLDVPAVRQREVLETLGFGVDQVGHDGFSVTVPSFRPDIDRKEDLVEEVLRIVGYNEIPEAEFVRSTNMPNSVVSTEQRKRLAVHRALAAQGLNEAVMFSFTNSRIAQHFGWDQDKQVALKVANPISEELDVMRPSLLPNLLDAAKRNAARGYPDIALFEVGLRFDDVTPEGQKRSVAGIRTGKMTPNHWTGTPAPVDAFDAKADLIQALRAYEAPVDNAQSSRDVPPWYHPGRSGALTLGKTVLGVFGELHPKVIKAMGIKGRVVAFEAYLDAVPVPRKPGRIGTQKPLLKPSALQPVHKDFAFVVDEHTAADAVIRAAKGADKKLITDVSLFDVYRGEGIANNKKSLAIAVTIQPSNATLTDDQLESIADKIIANVNKIGGVLRA